MVELLSKDPQAFYRFEIIDFCGQVRNCRCHTNFMQKLGIGRDRRRFVGGGGTLIEATLYRKWEVVEEGA